MDFRVSSKRGLSKNNQWNGKGISQVVLWYCLPAAGFAAILKPSLWGV